MSSFEINSNMYELKLTPNEMVSLPFNEIGNYASQFLNAPYLWGGRSMWGIDCSGFTQLLYKVIGVQLPRDAYQQAELGEPVDFVNETKMGDLAFFESDSGKITHVGLKGKGHGVRRQAVETVYEAQAMPKDHHVPSGEFGARNVL